MITTLRSALFSSTLVPALFSVPLLMLCLSTEGALRAQNCVYAPDNNAASGPTGTLPFGSSKLESHYIQFIVPPSVLGKTKREIRGLGFAPAASLVRHVGDFTITLRQTKKTTLTTDRLANIGGFSTTAQYNEIDWAVTANTWNRIPARYPYDPANGGLLVEIFCGGAVASGSGDLGFRQDPSVQVLTASGWGFQPPRNCTLTKGAPKLEICFDAPFTTLFDNASCKGSNGKFPRLDFAGSSQLGKTLEVKLSDAGSSGLAVLVWGFRSTAGLDLTAAGAPGCVLRMRLDFIFGFGTTNGAVSAFVPIPNDPKLAGVDPLGFQWFSFDPQANALQFVSSNWGFAQVGS